MLGDLINLLCQRIHQHCDHQRTDERASKVNTGQGVNLSCRRLEVSLSHRFKQSRVVRVFRFVRSCQAARFRAIVDAASLKESVRKNCSVRFSFATDSQCFLKKQISVDFSNTKLQKRFLKKETC